MSVNVYIGPYLRVRERVKTVEVDLCEGHDRGAAKFCPECGRERSVVTRSLGIPSEDFWCHPDWVDQLQCIETHEGSEGWSESLAITNTTRLGIYADDQHDGVVEVPDRVLALELFRVAHGKAVEKMRAVGYEVEVDFGVIAWSR